MMLEPSPTTTDGKTINGRRTQFRWVVLLCALGMYTIAFADRVNIGVVLPVIRDEFGMTNAQAGQLAGAFYLGYLITMLPVGFSLGRWGARAPVGIAIIFFSIFTGLIGFASSALQIFWYRIFLGCSESAIPPGGSLIIKNWHPKNEQATASGLFMAAGTAGQMLVPPVAAWIMLNYGWRSVFYWFAVPGVIMGVIWWLVVRNKPEQSPFCNKAEQDYIYIEDGTARASEEKRLADQGENVLTRIVDKIITRRPMQVIETIPQVFMSKNAWGTSLALCFLSFVSLGVLFWIPAFLVEAKGMSFARMGWIAAGIPLGGCFGCIIGGLISDKVLKNRRKMNMIVAPLSQIIMMYLLINVPNDPIILFIELFVTGFFLYLAWSCYFAYNMMITNSKTYPILAAMFNAIASLGGIFSPILAGYLLDVYKTYDAVFVMFGVAALLSFLSVALLITEPSELRETQPS